MKHTEEHIIELYILGSDLVKEQIDEIEAHLKVCHGCRKLAEEMETFYRNAEENFQHAPDVEKEASKALVRVHNALERYYEPYAPPVPYRPTTFIGKFQYIARLHPVTTGIGSFATVAMLGAAMIFGLKDFFKDTNPAYTHLNPERAVVEVYNKGNDLLWSFPSKGVYHLSQDQYAELSKKIIVADLNRDGRNEIITTLPIREKGGDEAIPLTIFSSDGKSSRDVQFQEHVQFRGVKYSETFGTTNMSCDDFGNDGRKEIIIATSNGRSPSIVYRLLSDGTILGQYFHFGMGRVFAINLQDDHRKALAFCGRNDVNDLDSLSYAVLIVIDPKRLLGKMEASDSRGFGLPVSSAEMYVVRFPLSGMNVALHSIAEVKDISSIQFGGKPAFQVNIVGNSKILEKDEYQYPIFEYVLAPDMTALTVKYEDITLLGRNDLITQGKVAGKIDQSYLDNLKNGVRYWNGTSWQKEPTMVKR
jgi:hypothetical protein